MGSHRTWRRHKRQNYGQLADFFKVMAGVAVAAALFLFGATWMPNVVNYSAGRLLLWRASAAMAGLSVASFLFYLGATLLNGRQTRQDRKDRRQSWQQMDVADTSARTSSQTSDTPPVPADSPDAEQVNRSGGIY